MSLDYTGDDTATQAPSPLPAKSATPIARLPVDGEVLNVASIYQPLKMLADAVDAFFDRGAWIDAANNWTALQTLAITGDDAPDLEFTAAITTRKLALRFDLGASKKARVYRTATPSLEITVNAVWQTGGQWARDAAGDSLKLVFNEDSVYLYTYDSLSASPWVDGSWTNVSIFSADGISSLSDVIATLRVEGRRFHTGGTALDSGDFALHANWGVGASVSAIAGTDTAGTVTVTAAGVPGLNPTVTLTFADGTFGSAPQMLVVMSDANVDSNIVLCRWTTSATQLVITWPGTPSAGNTFKFEWHAIGI